LTFGASTNAGQRYVVRVVTERDLTLQDGRALRVYDTGGDGFAVLWHHGSPQTGVLLPPLLEAAAQRGVRLLGYGRPSYGGSSPAPGRTVADAAGDVAQVAAALGLERFAVMGASGGGPHALACAALLGERVTGAACLASPAPYTEDFEWYAGMVAPGGLQAASAGREARAKHAETAEFDAASFTDADWATLEGEWSSLGQDAMRASNAGPDGEIDDDVAFASPWGFELAQIDVPVLLAQGGEDRVIPPSHAYALLEVLPRAELWLRPRDGHVSILRACPLALDWLISAG
jgi:pimeloyl-ACP methyl ester carboxylesterase